ncbi:MAG: phosphoribosylanthranilate isomerase [Burkholderiales bacterium]|nr:phosphoribosylanthranilate isomerase [Burkholderiales bacterium]
MRTRIKICGITSVADALRCAEAGADAVGLVFFPSSPRNVTLARAVEIARALPPFVSAVALFVNPQPEQVESVLAACPVDALQFHGEEPPELCARFGRPYLKALRVRPGVDLLESLRPYGAASGWLLDAFREGEYGGTGTAFDWSLIPAGLTRPVVLSGGLDPENVSDAVRRVRPWAVDVSSGVEAAKGIKDPARVAAFIAGVRNADV